MSTFGTLFKVTTYGESHCKSVGCIVDGVPPNMSLAEEDIQPQLTRRRPGQSKLTTQRNEKDRVQIQSGTEFGKTLGTPIGMIVLNQDQRPKDYNEMDKYPRPSHADYTYVEKYGIKASSGGGRASARETIGRVAAGAIAEKFLHQVNNVEIVAFVSGVGKCQLDRSSQNPEFMELLQNITRDQVDAADPIRCPIPDKADEMTKIVERYKADEDSIGGIVTCVVRNVPVGLGEPAFDKLEALLAHAMLSIPATKGFEIGSGFAGTEIPGSQHNDPFVLKGDRLGTTTNNSGGIQGGISNGESIYFSVAFKSPATISKPQDTASYEGAEGILAAKGRHDPNVVPRAIPIVEAMTALTLADAYLIQKARESTFGVVH
ncbi:DEKNAAC104516 [Brettanomyces naardenensis]|uniref:Chorismate synthase n=1 Tax=Brettanomyces naardenensis TaxID=13370 RepID=A0A448YRD0_BRENA|nr:DEKNAAC104516 [Brettanomyces naardenensis]